MINLEELKLLLMVVRSNRNYIDGNELYENILVYLPKLQNFKFSINTSIIKSRKRFLSSRENMKLSFIRKEYGPVGSYIETPKLQWKTIVFHHFSYPDAFQSRCHIYSLPYHFYDFYYLNNAFPGGLFNNVRNLSMAENRPFVANLFKIISESFPSLVALDIFNQQYVSAFLILNISVLDRPTWIISNNFSLINFVICLA